MGVLFLGKEMIKKPINGCRKEITGAHLLFVFEECLRVFSFC